MSPGCPHCCVGRLFHVNDGAVTSGHVQRLLTELDIQPVTMTRAKSNPRIKGRRIGRRTPDGVAIHTTARDQARGFNRAAHVRMIAPGTKGFAIYHDLRGTWNRSTTTSSPLSTGTIERTAAAGNASKQTCLASQGSSTRSLALRSENVLSRRRPRWPQYLAVMYLPHPNTARSPRQLLLGLPVPRLEPGPTVRDA